MRNFIKTKKIKGFTLLETLFTVFIISIGLLGILFFFPGAFLSESLVSDRLVASYLGQEGIEIVRNIRDTNWLEGLSSWDNGLAGCSAGCQADYNDPSLSSFNGLPLNLESASGLFGYGPGQPSPFTRKITINPIPPDILEVQAEVSWQERGRTHTIIVQENIYNWK